MIHLLRVGVFLWLALTLHGLNIKVSINQVICLLSEKLGSAGQCCPNATVGDPSCRAMSHLWHKVVKFIGQKSGARGPRSQDQLPRWFIVPVVIV